MRVTADQATYDRPPVWRFGLEPLDGWLYDKKVLLKHPDTFIAGERELAGQDYVLAKKYGMVQCGYYPLPPNTPTPTLHYPSLDGFLPDLFDCSNCLLCSVRLREAMALPAGVAQYLPLKVHASDTRVHAMSYQVLRVLAHQAAVDLPRSDVEIEERTDRHIGGTYRYVRFVSQLALRSDLEPQTDLFYAAELTGTIFARDALAERVMRAGCFGVCFKHPEEPRYWDEPYTIRTARGVEKAGPAARRAHLRRVKQVRGLSSNEPAYRPGPGSAT